VCSSPFDLEIAESCFYSMRAPDPAGHRDPNILLGLGVRIQLRSSIVITERAREQQFATTDALGRHVLSGEALVGQCLNGEWCEADRARVRRLIEHAGPFPRDRCSTELEPLEFLAINRHLISATSIIAAEWAR